MLVHGGWGDGEVAYEALVPQLSGRFTCYTPSTRGRGLSGDNPDHTAGRLVEDLVAFIDMVGAPVYLLGWSGIEAVLGAAAQSSSVAAVAIFEGYIPTVAGPGELAALGAAIERAAAPAVVGNLADAARSFAPYVINDAEHAALPPDFHEQWGRSIPAMLRYFQQNATAEGPRMYDAGRLAKVSAPVLALWGTRTTHPAFVRESARYLAEHVARGEVRELEGAGHFAPVVAPELLGGELTAFFDGVRAHGE
ncbi:hypothetical protein BIU82_02175 [Arthrobacter sp. SW1]|nr:hypothetical protein BIU82_02175 [Arthrobacter sp. SW1]